MSHLKQHWIRYIWLVIFAAFLAGLYFRTHTADAAGVIPVQTGQIGGNTSTSNGTYVPFYYPQSLGFDQNGNMFISDWNFVYKLDANDNLLTTFGGYGTTSGKTNYIERMTVDSQGNVYVADASGDSVVKYDNNGNFLFRFGSTGSGNGQFDYPIGVAVATSGEIYVADSDNGRIQKFDSNGNYISQFGTQGSGDGQLSCPYGLVIATSSEIYVTDSCNDRIQKFSSTGTFISKFGTSGSGDGQFTFPLNLVIDSVGNLFVSDVDNDRVQKFDAAGNFMSKFGVMGSADGQIDNAYGDIGIDGNDNIYVVDYRNDRVQKFDSSGNYIKQYNSGVNSQSKIIDPAGITKDSSNNIYVTDKNSVKKFDQNGNLLLKFGSSTQGSADGQFYIPRDLAVATSGDIYVADTYNNRIQKFDANGNFLLKFGTAGTGDGQFNEATALAIATSGDLYVVDTYNHRIQKFSGAGTFISKFGTAGSGDGQFNRPTDISLDDQGNIYVVDKLNNRIQKFSSAGVFISKFTTPEFGAGTFSGPSRMGLSKTGLYLTDNFTNKVLKYDFAGNFLFSLSDFGYGNNQIRYPVGVYVDSSENVYVSDTGNNRISIYSIPPFLFSGTNATTSSSITTFSWTTSREASSRVEYGLTSSYGTSTPVTNISPKVLTHSVPVNTGFPPCTTINYRLISTDEDNATSTSSGYTTNTGSCVNQAPIISSSAVVASSTATSTVSNNSIEISIPPAVSSTSTDIVFQANKIEPTTFFQLASTPIGKAAVTSEVFHLTAIDTTDNSIISTFTNPILVSITYSPSDLGTVDPTTLAIYRYDGSSWFPLTGCSTNTNTNTVSCYTSSFSDFALFATPVPVQAQVSGGGGIILPINAQVSNTNPVPTNPTQQLINQLTNSINTSTTKFSRALYKGLYGKDVETLQNILSVTYADIYTKKLVTGYFGELTRAAIKKLQCKYNIVCGGDEASTGWGRVGPRTRGVLNGN